MVERPILKSERQAKAETETEGNSENREFTPPVKSDRKENRRDRDRDRDKDKNRGRGKGKGRGKGRDEIKPPINPALARPPKPSKPPVKVEAEPEEVTETVAEGTEVAVAEESQDSSQEQDNS